MPKSKLFGLLDDIKDRSLKIGSHLSSHDANPDELVDIYLERQKLLEALETMINDESVSEVIQKNSARWQKEVENIQAIEQENINNLKNITSQFKNKLKQQMKTKSLLIYAK